MWYSLQEDTTSSQRTNDIKALFKRLGSLKIINKALEETYEQSDEEMSVAPASANENIQAIMPNSIISDSE